MIKHPVVIGTVHDMVPLPSNYPSCLKVNVRCHHLMIGEKAVPIFQYTSECKTSTRF